jgi:hypothetical protein
MTVISTQRIIRNGTLVATPGDELTDEYAAQFGILADGTKDESIPDAADVYALTKVQPTVVVELPEPTAAEKKAAKAEGDRMAAEAKAEQDRVAAEIAAAEAARTAAATPVEVAAETPAETA